MKKKSMMETSGQAEDNENGAVNDYQNWAEQHGFSQAGLALIWIVAAFILFQIFASLIAIGLVIFKASGTSGGIDPSRITSLIGQHMSLVFAGNSIGEVLFLALATWFFCRLQVSKTNRPSFLRLQFFDDTLRMIGIAFILILVIQPVIWFLGWLNSLIPIPESVQLQQVSVIEHYITSNNHLGVMLLNIALVPAFCEEILFRGYALRSFEKSWGIVTAIIVSGIMFGLFHLEAVNFFPLASIGILLAFLAWVTRSIFPAMMAHFVNNGTSVLMGKYYPHMAFSTAEQMPSPWLLIASILVSGYLIYLLVNDKMHTFTV
jgi:membrane protease YdiL (CAAX protease family)